jgi:hypothetical protein
MNITKKNIIHWLNAYNHSREWLGQQFDPPVSRRTVDNWLVSPQPIPRTKLPTIAALMRRDHAQAVGSAANHNTLKLDLTDEQFDRIELAAVRAQRPMRKWAIETLNNAAAEQILAKIQPPQPPQPPQSQPWVAQHHPQVIANIRQQLNQMAEEDSDDRAVN